ncbi:hypothetical protein JVU11DRAFT_7986 [Chiua virens]|nr:hypothetical protein JVU11DRAFT_7986 [Chiua virens]
MFAHNVIIRIVAIGAYIASTCTVAILSGFLWYFVQAEIPQGPTEPGRKTVIAWLYVPSLMLHSLLFGLKVYRFVTSPKYMQRDTFLWRFLTE